MNGEWRIQNSGNLEFGIWNLEFENLIMEYLEIFINGYTGYASYLWQEINYPSKSLHCKLT